MTVELPLPAASETVLPLTGLLFASSNVTVIADVLELSAVTDVGLAVTVDLPALTAPGLTVNAELLPEASVSPLLRVAVNTTPLSAFV